MKNFLLVVPQFSTRGKNYNFPIGIAYISSYLKEQGYNVFCLNLCHYDENIPVETILRENIEKYKIDVFLTGAMSFYWEKVEEILKLSKKIKPSIINIVGGAILTSDPELAMENLNADIGVLGESEHTIAQLAKILCDNGDKKNVNGICYMEDSKHQFIFVATGIPSIDQAGYIFQVGKIILQVIMQFFQPQ